MTEREVEYCMRRAREEAHLALTNDRPEVAAAHHGLSVQYAARARACRDASPAERMAIPLGAA